MGTFEATIEVGDRDRRRFLAVEALADSESTFTWIPRPTLQEMEHSPRFRIPLRPADGRLVECDATDGGPIRINGAVREVVCLFAEEGQQPLLGATTLENHLLAVDPVARRLVPMDALAT